MGETQSRLMKPMEKLEKLERSGIEDIKKLPIYMEEKRTLYRDLMTVYYFENDETELTKKKIRKFGRWFRLRLLWRVLFLAVKTYEFWEVSLREIEIQRGTLTSNVFLFIKWILKFNVVIAIIVSLFVLLPTIAFNAFRNEDNPIYKSVSCNSLFFKYDQEDRSGWNATVLEAIKTEQNKAIIFECCHDFYHQQRRHQGGTLDNKYLSWLITVADILGGDSSWSTTPFFYGFYRQPKETNQAEKGVLRVFYVLAFIIVFAFSFCLLVKSLSDGVEDIVRHKDGDNFVFTELVFNGHNSQTHSGNEARFRRKLWLRDLRVSIKRAKTFSKAAKKVSYGLLLFRIFANVWVVAMMGLTGYGIYMLSYYSLKESEKLVHDYPSLFAKFATVLPAIAVTVCNLIFQMILVKVGKQEKYTMEVFTMLLLLRSLFYRLVSLFVLLLRYFLESYCRQVIPGTCNKCPATPAHPNPEDRKTCWESRLAQELYKIIVLELMLKCISAYIIDPLRRFGKKVFFQSKIMRALGTLRFNAIRHSLDIINVQVLAWIGFYFAPFYPFVVLLYLIIIFYVKKHSAMVNCIETPQVYKITRTTVIFLFGLLGCFLIVTAFMVNVIGYLEPSKGCGPFGMFESPWIAFEKGMSLGENSSFSNSTVADLTSPSVYIVLQMLGLTVLFYYWSLTQLHMKKAEEVTNLILLEKEDKDYLITRLEEIRLKQKIKTFYDPNAVLFSERKFVESSHGAEYIMEKINAAWGKANRLHKMPSLLRIAAPRRVIADKEPAEPRRSVRIDTLTQQPKKTSKGRVSDVNVPPLATRTKAKMPPRGSQEMMTFRSPADPPAKTAKSKMTPKGGDKMPLSSRRTSEIGRTKSKTSIPTLKRSSSSKSIKAPPD